MKILLTGASGFVGGHLIKALIKRGHSIVATGYKHPLPFPEKHVIGYQVNILDSSAIKECLKKEKPEGVIHLAAQSNVPLSWKKIIYTSELNINGTINLLEAVHAVCPKVKFINIGSSEEYGHTAKKEKILDETMPCYPQNPYAISKYCAGQLALQFAAKYNLNIIHLRPFNHFGPGQRKGFVISDFASQIAEIEAGKTESKISVGNLEVYRDFSFIEDIVNAYVTVLETNLETGVYNIASGIARKIADILTILLGASSMQIAIEEDKNKLRSVEIPYFIGSSAKLIQRSNWQPEYSFEKGLLQTLEWWRLENQAPKSVVGGL